jgi:polyhydroxyalkanoate synthesis regulator phasin
MSEDRRKILEMLSQGKITVDEAERLMAALNKEAPSSRPGNDSEPGPKPKPKYIRVVVSDEEGKPEGTKVNIRVPMQLLRSGVKLVSLIPPQARDQVNFALHREGIQVDLNQIKPENLEELVEQLNDLSIDVDDNKTKVRVFCE